MVTVEDASISDEEFDLVDAAEPVSDLSSPADNPGALPQIPGHYGRAFDAGPLAGSEQPQQPQQQQQQQPQQQRQQPNQHQGAGTSGARSPRNDSWWGNDDSDKGKPSALKYTKSVVQKFWTGQDLLIAVMGMTGSGKTTFISKVTGRTDLNIGHSLTSCTRDIEVVETEIDGRVVRFVDTPGFSDTTLSDGEVLQLIADYLATAYKNDMKLSGIIYLHPISDTRVTHHATKNLQMFQKLTGENNLKNVMLATSMWDKVSAEEGERREAELKSKFWRVLLAWDARTVRYNGTRESARGMARTLMANKPFFVQLQREMGKDNKALRDTEAGRQVMMELAKLKEDHKRELADMEAMMRNSAVENKLVVEALKEHYQEKLKDLQRTLGDERRLNDEAIQSLTARIHTLEQRKCVIM
ncbi:P-loop containing nucleoside triphosphate hydrolase protein [Nemania sp. FL0031]|nr:P-loop containing nucleoside triphosphate hydrolase protein [Nemania sp. FL0031]